MTKSLYADRDTVGTIALKARESNDIPCAGDLGHELMPSLVEDINNAIKSNPYNDRPFYIIVHEKKDLMLKNTILRRIITSEVRPYPEPNTSVFRTFPKLDETRFCWSLPHHSLFDQCLLNPKYHNEEQLNDIRAYRDENVEWFGFKRVLTEDGKKTVVADPFFKDRPMTKKK